MLLYDRETSLPVADPDLLPIRDAFGRLEQNGSVTEQVGKAAESMILSVSGWRKVFAADREEESMLPEISAEDTLLAAIAAAAFADHLLAGRKQSRTAELVVGMDSRPTGPAIADAALRIFLGMGFTVRHLFIIAAPELMAFTALHEDAGAFFYISASHNPAGHNGLKFGKDGGVFGSEEAAALIDRFRSYCRDPGLPARLMELEAAAGKQQYAGCIGQIATNKLLALDIYRRFAIMTATSTRAVCGQDQVLNRIREYADTYGLGVVIDFNGSARCLSIDETLLRELGISVRTLADTPGMITHGIIPEGKNLEYCRQALETAYGEDPAFMLGYMPDNDGDRGNIVYIDESSARAEVLQAQEVFSLAVLSELAFTEYAEGTVEGVKRAVVVNGPTSMRIDAIAAHFGVEVHRCEVGEANTVQLARSLREEGYAVRILGEGSNGGNITYPASVRDPMNTILSFIKLLALRDSRESRGLFSIWLERSAQLHRYREHYALADILSTIPKAATTPTSSDRSILHTASPSQGALKRAYETLFARAWEEERETFFGPLNIASWKEFNTEGISCREGVGSRCRSGEERGGFKIVFYNADGEATDFIWMRGSGTEPVFRIAADSLYGTEERERTLLQWHADLVRRADTAACLEDGCPS